MITRIEIDGFKTFEDFTVDLQPFTAIVGPNASGKSNLFDALRFLSRTAQHDLRTAMKELRGEPEELFRQTPAGASTRMRIAVEVLLPPTGQDSFGQPYDLKSTRLRYELEIERRVGKDGRTEGVFIAREECRAIARKDEKSKLAKSVSWSRYRGTWKSQIETSGNKFIIRDKKGRTRLLPLDEATSSALSTIQTADWPHAFALRKLLLSLIFLQIDPQAARRPADRLAGRDLDPDAANLATVLANLKAETATADRPEGVIADISTQLAALVPSVRALRVREDANAREYVFDVEMADALRFSSRVISDGTLRMLALLTVLNHSAQRGVLCFEEPENGIHPGRIPALIGFLRDAAATGPEPSHLFQIILNTHSPAVIAQLHDGEVVAADLVKSVVPGNAASATRTLMRRVTSQGELFETSRHLDRSEVERLLSRRGDAA